MSDTFWHDFYPPNGWNCRCTVVQVRKSKYPETDHDEAMALGELASGKDKKGIFKFNSGMEQKTVPDYNPYTISACRTCPIAKGKTKLAKHFIPDNELCAACKLLRQTVKDPNDFHYNIIPTEKGKVRVHIKHGKSEKAKNTMIACYFANKYDYEIDLIPKLDDKPCADALNRTLGYEEEYKINTKPTVNSIDMAVKSAKRQADHIILWIDSEISWEDLANGIADRTYRCENIKSITVVRNGKDRTFTRKEILKNGFKIQQADLK